MNVQTMVDKSGGGKPPPQDEPAPAESRTEADRDAEPIDQVDVASMDSFPCSDPPGYYPIRS